MNALRNQSHSFDSALGPEEDDDSSSPVVLRYKTYGNRAGLLAILALFPFWAVWSPYAMLVLGSRIADGAADALACMIFSLLLTLSFLVLLAIFVCIDTQITIDAYGLSVPLRLLLATGMRRTLDWSDLHAVVFRKHEDEMRNQLVLQFGKVSVPLLVAGMSKDDLRKLVFSAQTYCSNPQPEALSPTFTELWENELNSRFSTTVFVPLPAGTRLKDGRIEVVGQTASGGLSAIYLARLDDGRKAILKELVTPAVADEGTRAKTLELFAREAALLRTLDHPRIAKVLDHFSEESRHYLVLEHIPGVDLRRFIRDNGRQHEELVLRWALDVVDILEYLHSRVPPVVHRDLTPDNLIFTTSGGIALIDFGAANAFVSEATGTLIGKQSYMAPEQLKGRATPLSDVYSLGCTMHFLLTGMDPEPLSVSHPARLNENVSDLCDSLVSSCTDQSRENRIDSAVAVGVRIHRILASRRAFFGVGV
jgi:tRNA A-37 threonylcarbamoyl transferase component Bud32